MLKVNFYKSFICIYACGRAAYSEIVTMELIRACCLPMLLYAAESPAPRACDISRLNNCINVAVSKIFHVSSNSSVNYTAR